MTNVTIKGKPQPTLTPCERCPFHQVRTLRRFTDEELEFIRKFKQSETVIEAGGTIFLENSDNTYIYTILSGWAFRYKTLEDGRRQILNFAMPSDFIGLQNAVFKTMKHSVEALTRTTLCVFNRAEMWSLYKNYPALAFDVTWIAAREEIMLHDHLISVGRRTATERVAYVLLHLFCRAQQLGLSKEKKLQLPITQQHLADALGISIVHTNKTLQKLANRNLISWRQGVFEMIDQKSLSDIAMYQYDDAYPRPFI